MTPIKFPNCKTLGAGGNPNTSDMPVEYLYDEYTPGPVFVTSQWQPTEEERAAIAAGGPVWLMLMANPVRPAPVPVMMMGTDPHLEPWEELGVVEIGKRFHVLPEKFQLLKSGKIDEFKIVDKGGNLIVKCPCMEYGADDNILVLGTDMDFVANGNVMLESIHPGERIVSRNKLYEAGTAIWINVLHQSLWRDGWNFRSHPNPEVIIYTKTKTDATNETKNS